MMICDVEGSHRMIFRLLTITFLFLRYVRLAMAGHRKLESPVTLFAAIEREQHEALRSIAFSERKSLANIAREALGEYIKRHRTSQSSRPRELRIATRRR